jgi:hypothetical protein
MKNTSSSEHPAPFAVSVLKREAHRNDPAVVVLVKLRHRDLHAGANSQVKSLRERKPAQDKSGRQEDLLLAVQRAARPERRILLEHRPDDSPDPIVHCGVEDDRPAEEICAGRGKTCSNRALDIHRSDSLGSCESRKQHSVTEAIWWSTCGNRAAEEDSNEVVAFAFWC